MTRNAYYVTTAISYPNGEPHIGHAYEMVATDAIARWRRLEGREVVRAGTALRVEDSSRPVHAGERPGSFEADDSFTGGDSYTVVKRQLLWVLIGVPGALIASRVPLRWVRRLAYPAFSISLVLLLVTAKFGVEVNGNTNWLALGPLQIQPSEIAKLSIIIWAAHIYANKDRRLGNLHQIMVPVVPGMLLHLSGN